ncbi:YqgE/AlgH family protein, partial [Desulfoluna sp.]|uniref:YqgE/AlgH family protein n=1 Tax=Desulfoluna sp. TaxID=2045199 RepID=UPI00260E839F
MSGEAFQSLKGQFLLAMPSMKDATFSRAVVYVCEHTADGAMGFIVNRPSTLMAACDVFKEFNLDPVDSAASVPVYTGGPVQLDELFLLHGPPFDSEGTYPMG